MAEHANVIRVSHYWPAPGRQAEVTTLLEEGAKRIREIDGCFGVQVCTSREDPDVLVAVSRWASQSGIDQMLKMMQRGGDLDVSGHADLLASPPRSEHLTPI